MRNLIILTKTSISAEEVEYEARRTTAGISDVVKQIHNISNKFGVDQMNRFLEDIFNSIVVKERQLCRFMNAIQKELSI